MARYMLIDFLTLGSIVGVIVVNFVTPASVQVPQISDQFFTVLTPAGYAFYIWLAIWGVQLLAITWLLYRPDEEDESTKRKQQISQDVGPWWISGALLEIAWLFLYSTATKRAFAVAAISLIYASFAFTQALFAVEVASAPKVFTRDGTGLVAAGSAINAAWLSVASAVCVLSLQPVPTEQIELAWVLLACIAGIGLFVSMRTASIAYPLTLVWALIAVLLVGDRDRSVRALAGVVAGLSGLIALVNLVTRFFGSASHSKEDDDDHDAVGGDIETGDASAE